MDVTETAEIERAARALRDGGLVILPTETVYGLAGDASNPEAVAAIFEAKGRPRFNPLISHVADLAAAEAIAVFDERARRLAAAFWPGPLTLVLPVREGAPVSDPASSWTASTTPAGPLGRPGARRSSRGPGSKPTRLAAARTAPRDSAQDTTSL